MRNPFTRTPKPYVAERNRLLEYIQLLSPASDEYHTVLQRINELDKILNRTSEKFKTVVPAFGTALAIGGVYALQQFGGILVPKALETLAARSDAKKSPKEDD
jgi:hypothetical protein